MPSSGFAGSFRISTIPGAHYKHITDVQLSVSSLTRAATGSLTRSLTYSFLLQDHAPMPTNSQLRTLATQPDAELDYNDAADRKHFQAAHQKLLFGFADQARDSGAKTNGTDGIFLGKDVLSKEI